MKKKNIWMKIMAYLALIGLFASIIAVWVMSFLAPPQTPVKQQEAPMLNIDYANMKNTTSNKIKVWDIKVEKEVDTDKKEVEKKEVEKK